MPSLSHSPSTESSLLLASRICFVLGGLVWLSFTLSMLILWLANGRPKYDGVDYDIVFLSDVGANYEAAFIVCTALTGGFFLLGLAFQVLRWGLFFPRSGVSFRCAHCCYTRRMTALSPASLERAERDLETWQFRARLLLKSIAIPSGILLSIFLILLGIFKISSNQSTHQLFTFGFILCVILYAFSVLIDQWGTPAPVGMMPPPPIPASEVAQQGDEQLQGGGERERAAAATRGSRLRQACTGRLKDFLAALFLALGAALAIADGILYLSCHARADYSCNGVISTAAVIEWVLSFFFAIYLVCEGVASNYYAYGRPPSAAEMNVHSNQDQQQQQQLQQQQQQHRIDIDEAAGRVQHVPPTTPHDE